MPSLLCATRRFPGLVPSPKGQQGQQGRQGPKGPARRGAPNLRPRHPMGILVRNCRCRSIRSRLVGTQPQSPWPLKPQSSIVNPPSVWLRPLAASGLCPSVLKGFPAVLRTLPGSAVRKTVLRRRRAEDRIGVGLEWPARRNTGLGQRRPPDKGARAPAGAGRPVEEEAGHG
jgi:hypothetical protein